MLKKEGKANNTQDKGIFSSITAKLIVALIPMVSVSIIFMIVFLSNQANEIIVNLAKSSLKQETVANANYFSGNISTFIGKLDTLAISLETFKHDSNEDLLKYLTKESKKFSSDAPNGVYLALDDGSWIDPSGWKPDADYVVEDRPWYKDGIKNDTFQLGKPYMDMVTNSMVVPVARKIKLADGRSGVASTDMSLASIMETVSELKPMESGKTMLFTDEAIISFVDKALNGTMIREHKDNDFLTAAVSGGDSTSVREEKVKGRAYYMVKKKVAGTDWTLVSSVDEADVLKELRQFRMICWIFATILILVIAIVMFRLITHTITKPVKKLTNNIIRITNSDFTVEIDDRGKDEISLMNRNMKKFIEHMRSSLGQMQKETMQLSDEASQSRSFSETMNIEAREQSNSMNQIRSAMDGMASAVTELAENATELAGMISELSTAGNEADDTMKQLIERAGEGQRDMKVVTSSMNTISNAMNEMNKVVDSVQKSAQQITGIVEMINSIAEQTNLLSLNASIEAARTGEAGKGFAVVATEIGSLANDSANASKEIGSIISEIMDEIANLTQKSASSMVEITHSMESVSVAENSFKNIFHNLDLTGESMQKMIGMMGRIDGISMNVAAISEEQSASSQQVTATVESLALSAGQVAEGSQAVTDSANTVSESAENINKFVATFKL